MKNRFNLQSVLSYPDRGHWGNSKWRGNTTGHIINDLIGHFSARSFVDVCEGSGTSRDLCNDLGIKYYGFDLHSGHDFTADYVLKSIDAPADMVFSHPPYHNMITYSGNVWGQNHSADTSRCINIDEFLEKSQVMLQNQREATREGGIYCSLIGDHRNRKFGYRSYQADFIQMMPKSELYSVVIKQQNNPSSSWKTYSGNFIPILHEYLILWKKSKKCLFQVSFEVALNATQFVSKTWRTAIRLAFMRLGKIASLSNIYLEVERVAGHLIANNKNWKAKIRQTLQKHYQNVERGVWGIEQVA